MSSENVSKRRARRWLIGLALVAAALAVWARPWTLCLMTAEVSVTPEGEETRVVMRAREWFRAGGGDAAIAGERIDLSRWEGRLVRLDVKDKVRALWPAGDPGKRFAWSLAVSSPAGEKTLDFVGWPIDFDRPMHRAALGVRSFKQETPEGKSVTLPARGELWYVLRVPPGASLQVQFRPSAEPALEAKHLAPPAGQTPLPTKSASPERGRPPDVFIYLIDALRADHLGCYGYERGTSPGMDAFAAAATLYEEAHTASTWTRPSVASLLTGVYPYFHGVMSETDVLDAWLVLLPEVLKETGYATWSVLANGNVYDTYGFGQGYDGVTFQNLAPAGWLNVQAEQFLARQDGDRPVFMYLHTVEPHDPYSPGKEALRRFDRGIAGACEGSVEALEAVGHLSPDLSRQDIEHLIDLYDAEIFEADAGFVEFLELLRRTGRYENALVVLVSDHGESFGEHATLRHGFNLNREEMQVPLVVRFPGGAHAGERIERRVSLVDLFPTILRLAGAEPELPYDIWGVDISPEALAARGDGPRPIYAEVSHAKDNAVDLVGVIDEDGYKRVLKVTLPPFDEVTERSVGLWDTRADPGEVNSLLENNPVRAAYAEQLVARWLAVQAHRREALAPGEAPSAVITEERRKELRDLGYLR